MARRFVDLSIAIEMGVASDPPGMEPVIEYTRHVAGKGASGRISARGPLAHCRRSTLPLCRQ
jgi:hypothetical protein